MYTHATTHTHTHTEKQAERSCSEGFVLKSSKKHDTKCINTNISKCLCLNKCQWVLGSPNKNSGS